MKKEYYIQGDPARAEEIKAAFKAKGIDTASFGLNHDEFLYYSSNGLLYFEDFSSALLNVFKTNPGYTELPLSAEPKFKARDWVVRKDGKPFCGGKYAEQITLIGTDEKGKHMFLSSSTWVNEDDDDIRLWTIQDAKDGDVLATDNGWACIFKAFDGWTFSSYCFMDSENWFCEFGSEVHTPDSRLNGNIHPATKEQRDLFFKKMKEAGYEWDADKKELRKTIDEPIFKVGDEIFRPACNEYFKIKDIEKDNGTVWYVTTRTRITHNDGRTGGIIRINARYQNEYNIAPKSHYDIANFHEGMPVLVRDDNSDEWNYLLFSHYRKKFSDHFFAGGSPWCQCIPFGEETKHLLGTTDPCDERYVNW